MTLELTPAALEAIREMPPTRPRPQPVRYPWAEWLDGRTHLAAEGRDFWTKPESFHAALHKQAEREDLFCNTARYRFVDPDGSLRTAFLFSYSI